MPLAIVLLRKGATHGKQETKRANHYSGNRRRFVLCLDGYGPSQIARILKEDKIITPTIHFQQTGRATRNAPPNKDRQDYFVCSTSRLKGKDVCSTHFIREVILEQGVLAHMRMMIACIANHEEQLRKHF